MVMYRAMQAEPVERPAENPIGKMWKKLKDTFGKEGTEESLPPLENGPYIKNGKPNGRPTLSGKKKLEFEKEVYKKCVDEDGVLRDPNTREIFNWKPGEPRKGVVDFGINQENRSMKCFKSIKIGK